MIGILWHFILLAHHPIIGEDINWPILKAETIHPKNEVSVVVSILSNENISRHFV